VGTVIGPVISGFSHWTKITGVSSGEVLFYDSSTGIAAASHIYPDGSYQFQQSFTIDPGWTHIVGAGNGEVFFYNENAGTGATGYLENSTGQFTPQRNIDGFSTWTNVAYAGRGQILFYNSDTLSPLRLLAPPEPAPNPAQ
jgi:hypothetical protein